MRSSEYSRAYYLAHREEIRIKSAKWQAANKERVKAQNHARYERNKAKVMATVKAWKAKNKDKALAIKAAWAKRNPEKMRKYWRESKRRERERKAIEALRIVREKQEKVRRHKESLHEFIRRRAE